MKRAPFAIALVVAALANVALADDVAHRRAAESFRQAQAAFERRDFAAAAAAFEQAATFEPHPSPLLNAADAWERAGEPVRAADDCDRALLLPNATTAHKSDAEQCLRRLAPKLATLDFRGPSTIAVRIDDGAQLIVPVRKRVAPGRHAIVVVDLGSSQSHATDVDVRGGEARVVDVTPSTPAPAPTPTPAPSPPPAEPDRAVPTSAWIAFGVGGAAAVVATTFGLFTLGAKSDFDANATQAGADTFHRDKTITNVAWLVAGVGAVSGIVLWLSAPRGTTVGIVPNGVVARVSFR